MVKKLWPILFLLGVSLLFFYKTVLFQKMPFPGDLLLSEYAPWRQSSYHGYAAGAVPSKAQYFDVARELYPWKTLVIEELKKGRVPLWNPYNFSGSPLLANYQSAVFYPLNILYFFFPFITAWTVLIILQALLGSLFLYWYAREIGLTKIGAIIAAIAYNFSSFANVWIEFNTVWHTILWLPLMLWTVEKSITDKKISFLRQFIFVGAMFSSMTAGHPQDFLYTIFFFVIYAIFRITTHASLYRKQKVLFGIQFSMLTVYTFLLGAAQLLPTIALFSKSARVPHDHQFIVQSMLIQPWQMVMLFVQDFFGNPATKSYFLSDTYVGKTLSIGIAGIFMVFFSLWSRKRTWHSHFFLCVTGIILLLTIHTPLTQLLYRFPVPILSTGSPTRILSLLMLSLAILAGYGVDTYQNQPSILKKIITYFCFIIGPLWIFVLLGNSIPHISFTAANFHTMRRAMIFVTAVWGSAVVLLWIGKNNIASRAFVLILVGELLYGFLKFNPLIPSTFVYPDNAVLSFLKEKAGINRYWGYGTGRIEANFATQYHIFSPDGTDPLNLKYYNQFIQASQDGNVARAFTRSTRSDANILPGYGTSDLPTNTARLRVLDALGVKYILNRVENPKDNKTFDIERFTLVWEHDGWIIFENKKAAPRYFLTGNVSTYTSTEDFEQKFFSPTFDPASSVLVASNREPLPEVFQAEIASVQLTSYEPTSITFSTTTSAPQLLYLSDTYDDGWLATIDTTPTTMYKANFAFRGVVVPEGKHTVMFSYRPRSFAIGSIVSFLAIIFGGIYGGYHFFSTRRISRPS